MRAQIASFTARSLPLDHGGRNGVPVYVVAGATTMGIGVCYEVARELKARGFDLRAVGIVCDKANGYPEDIAPDLDYYIDVPSPDGTWNVPMDDGGSHMVDVLMHSPSAKASFMGGGTVAKAEMEELDRRLQAGDPSGTVEIEIRRGGKFAPSRAAVAKIEAKCAAQGRSLDPYAFDGTRDYAEGVFHGVPPERIAPRPVPSPAVG